ncbi:MAG: M20/M25/M40 family metallo-hydrolase [Spirochaetales bacterium]|nr:M20/M25/M40 family metallo-hydrolase [Spirochaetales bacterium]
MEQPSEVNVLEEAKRLISIESITGNEGEVMGYLEKRFKALGCRVKRYEAAPGRPNIYAEAGGTPGETPALLFHGHLDTVPAYGMADPFTPKVIDGNLYGRGSVDQKSGVAAVIAAFEEILKGDLPDRSFAFVGVIDEESEHRGSMALKDMGIKADFGVITEPSDLKIGVGCKGTAPILLEVKGLAAHGCRPWLGKNAVIAGMFVADKIMKMELPSIEMEGLGEIKASINLGKIEGGEAYNIVPDLCSLWFDRRLIPGETQNDIICDIYELIGNLPGTEEFTFNCRVARPDWNWPPIEARGLHPAMTRLEAPEVSVMKSVHRDILGRKAELFYTDGYHEMDFLVNDLGINAVQYGPGKGALCHTDEEHIEIGQLTECARVYQGLIREFCYIK